MKKIMEKMQQKRYRLLLGCVMLAGILFGLWIGQKVNEDGDIDTIDEVRVTVESTGEREVPIYFVETEEKKIAISFDAAWGCEHTQDILNVLDCYQMKATFFLTNIWLEAYPDMAKRIADAGHEIAMHSASHPHMPELSAAEMEQELKKNYDCIIETTQFTPELFRFPFGDYDNQSMHIVRENGFYPVQWSIDSLDWMEQKSKEDIIDRVTIGIHPGAIILCHNNGIHTADAIAEIIPRVIEQGYVFVPIGELIYKGSYMTDHQGMQKKA